jgi:hypothetical protein
MPSSLGRSRPHAGAAIVFLRERSAFVSARVRAALVTAISLLLIAPPAHAQIVVDTCGQSVAGDAVLMADLDCSAAALPSVTFTKNATFTLGDHTLTGQISSIASKLEVLGPGVVTGPGYGIAAEGNDLHGGKVTVRSVDVTGNELDGIVAFGIGRSAAATAIDCSITGNGGSGVWVAAGPICPALGCDPLEKARVDGCTVSGNAKSGIRASKIDVRSSTISSNGEHGVHIVKQDSSRKLRLSDSDVSDNTQDGVFIDFWSRAKVLVRSSVISRNAMGIHDVAGDRAVIKLKEATLEENGTGVRTGANTPEYRKKVLVLDSSILGSATSGIVSTGDESFVTVKRSTLAGAGTAPECGVSEACADLDSDTLPVVKSGAACESSHVRSSGFPGSSWGVCTND